MDDKKHEIPIPRTVGEMIEFLQKFPMDFNLDFFYPADWGGDVDAHDMDVLVLDDAKEIEITIK